MKERKPLLVYSRCSVPQGDDGKSTCRPPGDDAFDGKKYAEHDKKDTFGDKNYTFDDKNDPVHDMND